jgi:chromosomal replication initiator protein
MTDIWSEALQGLQPRLGAQTYDLWLRPIALRQVAAPVCISPRPIGS